MANAGGDRFLTVVIADGAPTVFSEETYDDRAKWDLAIEDAMANSSINRVYLPDDWEFELDDPQDRRNKTCWYASNELSVPTGIAPVRRHHRFSILFAIAAIAGVVALGAVTTWFVHDRDARAIKASEISRTEDRVTEMSRIDVDPIIDHCMETLGEFWPMAPEWTLIDEGCVVDPARLPRSLPNIPTSDAFSYRHYRLVGQWNTYLAVHAAERVTREFTGSIHRDSSGIVLYQEIAPSRQIVDRGERPRSDIVAVLERLFIGNARIEGGNADRNGIVNASTALDMISVLDRMKTDMFEVVSVNRKPDSSITNFRVRPVRLQAERTHSIEGGDSVR